MKKIFIASMLASIVLMLWNGFSQVLPWGVSAVKIYTTQENAATEQFQVDNIEKFLPHSIVTEKFDKLMANEVSTVFTDKTFSWIISRPLSYYDMKSYFIRSFFIELIVGLLLTLLSVRTISMRFGDRMIVFMLIALTATIGINGEQMNWWGLPPIYAVGVSVNLLLGWMLVSFILCKWIFKSTKTKL